MVGLRAPALAIAIASSGCGRLFFDERADASTDEGALTIDASARRFGPPVPVANVNLALDDDEGASIDRDGRELYFTSTRVNGFALWFATRGGPGQAWSAPQRIANLDVSGVIEFDPDVRGDRNELLYSTNATPQGTWSVVRALDGTWMAPGTQIVAASNRFSPCLFDGGLRMLVEAPAGGIEELLRTSLLEKWQVVASRPELAGFRSCGIREDGLELFLIHATESRLYRTERAAIAAAFAPPERYLFGSPLDDEIADDPELSTDGGTLYLSFDLSGTDFDIYESMR